MIKYLREYEGLLRTYRKHSKGLGAEINGKQTEIFLLRDSWADKIQELLDKNKLNITRVILSSDKKNVKQRP